VLAENSEEALLKVSTRQVDATIENLAVAGHLLNLRGLANLMISGVTSYEFPLRFAVRKDTPMLASILNKGLDSITPQEHQIIYTKYLHPAFGKARDWGAWRRRAAYAIFGGAAIAAVLLAWNRTIVRQIRHCKKVESELREARDKLQQRTHELDQRVRDVERLNHELTIANKDLDSFASSVSHDLRAPLRRVSCFASLIQNHTQSAADHETREYWSMINQQTSRMDHLIADLLAFARVGRAEMRAGPVDMQRLTKQIVNEFLPETHGREVEWHIGALPVVIGDASLLRQVMVNLIENAVKFTRKRSRAVIKIDVLPARPEDTEVVIYIQDNGCGFDMRCAKMLFGPFRRLHNEVEYEGTGIGLVNVHRIIQRHGGRVWAEAAPDRGATFWFSLPRLNH
jgi:signal transduction histidine kinase